jgi:cyclopropane fatty-acyl-phospholipid synthase-like methyltransferase
MAQITNGIRSILSIPMIYTGFQLLMGARTIWRYLAIDIMQVKPGMTILDIGCGPADLLDYLPDDVSYYGFDISPEYIERAHTKYGARGQFSCKLFEESDLECLPKFDRVVLVGVFHHMDDTQAKNIAKLAHLALKDGGKLVSVDPCYAQDQNPVARYLISKDRGQNVRVESAYKAIVNRTFKHIDTRIVHRAWIPYTHCYMVCSK